MSEFTETLFALTPAQRRAYYEALGALPTDHVRRLTEGELLAIMRRIQYQQPFRGWRRREPRLPITQEVSDAVG